MILFIAMAIATTSILVVGTLAAADIIRVGPREATPDAHHTSQGGDRNEVPARAPLDPPTPTAEEADVWGMDSFPASDPPQNW